MKKPRKIHIDGETIKWRFRYGLYNCNPYIGIWDGEYHRVTLPEFISHIGEADTSIYDDYDWGNRRIPQLTPGNVKKYYLEKIKKNV